MEDFVKLNIEDILGCINGKDENGESFKVINPPHNEVKEEFTKFVNQQIKERRKNSSISSMRDLHNFIKRVLIINITNLYLSQHRGEQLALLDISCGRGGDLQKWNAAHIKNVFGFDKSHESIFSINPMNQGLEQRYLNSKKQIQTNVEFDVGDAIQPSVELINRIGMFMEKHKLINKNKPELSGFQLMSCQFALHYFFQSEQALRNMLGMFSQFLRRGGYFIGTCVDGKRITELLGKSTTFDSQLLSVTKKFKAVNPTKAFGNQYTFSIKDTVDQGNYFNTLGESTEYLVFMDKFINLAKEYNLEPVFLNIFEPIESNVYTNTYGKFVSFEEIYKLNVWNKTLNKDELLINNLYTTFVFIKV